MTDETDEQRLRRAELDLVGELFEIRVRGAIARMFMLRSDFPNVDQLAKLRGGSELTVRDIGRIAYELNFFVDFQVVAKETIPVEEPGPDEV